MTYKRQEICAVCGRMWASWFQHCCISAHKPSVKLGWIGRGGRSPLVIANTAARGDFSLNGAAPVKAFVQIIHSLASSSFSATNLDRDARK
jgi:hypothetical protein